MGFLLAFLPDEVLPLLLVGAALALMVGLLAPRAFGGLLLAIVFMAMLGPFIEAAVGSVGLTLQLLMLLGLGVFLVRGLFSLLLGRGAADRLVAHLAYDVIVLPFRLIGVLLRAVFVGHDRHPRWR